MVEQLFALESEALPGAVLVGFRGVERVCRPYWIEVFVALVDTGALGTVTGTKLSVKVNREPEYAIHGIVAEAELLHTMPERSLVRLSLVPRLWLLGLSHHSRMFTDKSIPDIVEQVLKDAGFGGDDYELRLDGSYATEEHVCQYQESDLAFVSRWLEHEGIHYFFEHDGSVEKLIISDQGASHAALASAPIRYFPQGGDTSADLFLSRFRAERSVRPTSVRLGDYDYANPGLEVAGDSDADAGGFGTVVEHGGDRFFAPGRGKALAAVRAEELAAEQRLHRAEGRALHLRSGYCFELGEHPIGWLNKQYLCVELEHHANVGARTVELARLTGLDQQETYRARLLAIDGATPYRPPRVTPRPRAAGLLCGVVDGEADSDYAQLDDQGRYRIILNFDESGLSGGKATTALRMMQPHAGNPEGMHFPLRKGTEVLVTFLGGDPDRPLIAGAVPNAHTPSAVTSANHTHNVVHTGGDNRFDVEDQDGAQWVTLSTPTEDTYMHLGTPHDKRTHNIVLHTKGDNLFDYGTNQDIIVGGKLDETVEGAVTETYSAKQTSLVHGKQSTTVTGATEEIYQSTQTTLTLGQVTETYNVGHDTTVNAAPRDETFLASQTTNVSGGLTQQHNGDHLRVVVGDTSTTHASLDRHVGGATTQMYAGNVTRLWGPTTSEQATLNWSIPGGVTSIGALHIVRVPTDLWARPSWQSVLGLKFKITGLVLEAVLAKAEATGVAIGATGRKLELSGGAIAVVGIKLSVAPIKANEHASIDEEGIGLVLYP